MERERPIIAVWFSCGAASAVAAKLTVEWFFPLYDVRILNNPVAEEPEDNRRFLLDCEKWIGLPIELVTHPEYLDAKCQDVWEDRRFMSGVNGAPCTLILKKQARQLWENENHVDFHVLGFTADEKHRFDRFVLTERENVLNILGDAGITKQDCITILENEGITLPISYFHGLPNANCTGCVKATSPTYWNKIREIAPEVFTKRADTSRRLGAKLVRYRGTRIYLDELPPDAVGKPLRSMDLECGTFCEERG
jgi:hypothetical protein